MIIEIENWNGESKSRIEIESSKCTEWKLRIEMDKIWNCQ